MGAVPSPYASPHLPPGAGNWGAYPPGSPGNYRGYRSPYRYGRRGRSSGAPLTIGGWVGTVILGAVTFGFYWLMLAIMSWRAWARSRGSGLPLARLWKIQASVLSGLSAVALLFWVAGLVGASVNASTSSSASGSPFPPTIHASLGQTVTVVAPVGGSKDTNAKVRVTVSDFEHNSPSVALRPGDTASARVQACAVNQSVDQFAVAFNFNLLTLDGGSGTADIPLTGTFSAEAPRLRPGQCATAILPFRIPASSVITSVDFGLGQFVQWSVPQSPVSSTNS